MGFNTGMLALASLAFVVRSTKKPHKETEPRSLDWTHADEGMARRILVLSPHANCHTRKGLFRWNRERTPHDL